RALLAHPRPSHRGRSPLPASRARLLRGEPCPSPARPRHRLRAAPRGAGDAVSDGSLSPGAPAPIPARILFILEYFPPPGGGAETLFGELASALAADGHQVTVLTARVPGAPARETVRGVRVIRVATPPFASRYLFTFLCLPWALALARHADLIHTSLYTAAFPAWFSSRLWRVPAVLTVHEVFGRQWRRLPRMSVGAAAIAWGLEGPAVRLRFARFVCVSEHTRRRLLETAPVDPRRASVCYPAVDYAFWDRRRFEARPLKRELGLGDETFLFLFFGRPGVAKGVEFLLEAVNQLRRADRRFHLLLLLGSHPRAQPRLLLKTIPPPRLARSITIQPSVSRQGLPGYLLGADCVVVPSLSEGFGYSAIEAAQLGCPLIATRGNSLEEVVGDYAVLCPAGNGKALAEAMGTVMRAVARRTDPPQPPCTLARRLQGMLAIYQPLLDGKAARTERSHRIAGSLLWSCPPLMIIRSAP